MAHRDQRGHRAPGTHAVTAVPSTMAAGMVRRLLLPAPAKLNLFLHVVGRRPDGYHELQTLFRLVDLCDEVCIELRVDAGGGGVPDPGASQVTLAADSDGPREGNLIARAAERLLAAVPADIARAARVHVGVRKAIPQGGLGGGSSDAATVLLGLNHLLGSPLDLDALATLGRGLGADVPVFVRGRNAWAEGIGELLTPMAVPPAWYLILSPGVEVPTAVVFGHVSLTRDTPVMRMRGSLESGVRNDCESLVRRLYPEVDRALDWLSSRASARLTGTGGCVFAAFASEEDARRVAAQVPAPWRAFVAAGLESSPVHALLSSPAAQ